MRLRLIFLCELSIILSVNSVLSFQGITAIENVAEAILHLDEANWDLLVSLTLKLFAFVLDVFVELKICFSLQLIE